MGHGNRVAAGRVVQLHLLTASLQYEMWQCVEEAGTRNTAAGGGRRWEVEQGKALLGKCMQI